MVKMWTGGRAKKARAARDATRARVAREATRACDSDILSCNMLLSRLPKRVSVW